MMISFPSIQERNCLLHHLLQYHVAEVDLHLALLEVVVQPMVLVLDYLLGQHPSQSFLPRLLEQLFIETFLLRWVALVVKNEDLTWQSPNLG